jgi:hypothetical protein
VIPSLCRNFEIEDSQQQHMDEERKEVSQARQIYTSTIYSTSGLFGLGAWGWYYLTTTSTSTSTSTTTVSRFTGQAGHIEHCKAKKYRNFETNIPRKGISGSQSQFPHSSVCERFIYSHDPSAYSARGNM